MTIVIRIELHKPDIINDPAEQYETKTRLVAVAVERAINDHFRQFGMVTHCDVEVTR